MKKHSHRQNLWQIISKLYVLVLFLPLFYESALSELTISAQIEHVAAAPSDNNSKTFNQFQYGDEEMNDEQRLIYEFRLRFYDPSTRPVFNASKPIIVGFTFALVQVCDVDERNEVLTTTVWFHQV